MIDKRLAARWLGVALLAAGTVMTHAGCGVLPERVSHDDPRLKPMFDAMALVDRQTMGFTPVARESDVRIEWVTKYGRLLFGQRNYDVMLHVGGRTSKTIAFRRNGEGYEWIGEQEIFEGPRKYKSADGTFNEHISVTYDRVPMSGYPINTIAVDYWGEEPELDWPKQLSIESVRPWLKKWGY